MDRAVDYDFYDDDDLRYVRFKSPFNCRPLIGRRPPLGYAVLLRAPACWFVRTLAEINFGELFGNFDGFAPWCLSVCVRAGRAWGKRTLHIVGSSSSDYLHQWCTTLFGRFSLCREERGSIVVDIDIYFLLVIVAVKRLHLVIFFMTATTGRMRCWRAIRL